MKTKEIKITCPFCHGKGSAKVDVSDVLDREIQEALIKVYENLKE